MWLKRGSPPVLGDFEQLVLFAVLRLDEEGYGASIQREIEARTGRSVSINAVYTTLDRLEGKRLVRSWTGEPTAQRGGRRRKHYALEPRGLAAVRLAYETFRLMTAGLERRLQRS
jgi:DNA-binding PadR family transcriptional regulator